MTRRTLILGAALAGIAVLASAPVAIGGFGDETILRTALAGTALTAGDVDAKGANVVVGWQEDPLGGGKSVYLRTSNDGGQTFHPRLHLDPGAEQQREVRVDTCEGWAWAVSGLHNSGAPAAEWKVVLDGHQIGDPGIFESSLVSFSGTNREPDIACVGNKRLAIAWLQKVGGVYRANVFARGVIFLPKGDNPPEHSFDLGTAAVSKGISIAATEDRIHVAWFRGDDLRYKRFDVGAGPDYPVTPLPTVTIATLPEAAFTPVLGADGDRVVLAYTKKADLVARISLNGGDSFLAADNLLDVPFPSEVAAFASNADIKEHRIIVSATVIGGDLIGLSGEGFIKRTTNDGASWATVPGSIKDGGRAVGAWSRPGGTFRIVEIWDRYMADPAIERLRFQRQT